MDIGYGSWINENIQYNIRDGQYKYKSTQKGAKYILTNKIIESKECIIDEWDDFSDGIKITMTEIRSGNSIHLGLNYIDKELIKTIYEHYKGRKPITIQLSVNEDSEWQTEMIIDKDTANTKYWMILNR